MTLSVLLWTGIGFFVGAIPFSVLCTRWLAGRDPRMHGDHNPGAFNAWRSGGWRAGVPAMLLDFSKGALPVGLAHLRAGISGPALLPIALAPVLGHAFSPFMQFRGGKALAATFGIWAGLTLGQAPLMLGLFFGLFFFTLSVDAWAVLLGMLGLLAHLILSRAWPLLLAVWAGNTLILAWTHRHELRQAPGINPRLLERVRGGR